jgi:hypothetical protein
VTSRLVAPAILATCALGAVVLRTPLADANASRRLPGMRFTPQPRLARLFSLGHRSSAADLLWLSAIGDLSKDFGDPARKHRWIETVLRAITTLEPSFTTVYSYGASYLTTIDRDPDRAIALLEDGVARNPDDLRLGVDLAMSYYVNRHDRAATLKELEKVCASPDCDSLTKGFYASLLVDEREDFAALAQWQAFVESSNERVREMGELQQERAKRRIAIRACDEFKTRHGRPPRTANELREPGLMAPEVVEFVVDAIWIDAAGKYRFPHCDELELRHTLRAASEWIAQYHVENGHSPRLDEVLGYRGLRIPPAPRGRHYDLVDDHLRLVDDGS